MIRELDQPGQVVALEVTLTGSTSSSESTRGIGVTINPKIFGGKQIIRGHRLAVEHILGMLATGDTREIISRVTRGWKGRTFRPASSAPSG